MAHRAEIGNYLGMTLAQVSRQFSRLAEFGLIAFDDKRHWYFAIPEIDARVAFVEIRARS